jgi:hypothetical protein
MIRLVVSNPSGDEGEPDAVHAAAVEQFLAGVQKNATAHTVLRFGSQIHCMFQIGA